MKKVIITLSLILALTISQNVYSAFKDSGWGARPVSIGGAYVAVSDDATGILYNPAGIGQIRKYEINTMYGELYKGLDAVNLSIGYASIVIPFGENADIGLQWANFVSRDLYGEDTFTLNYAVRLNNFLGKVFESKIRNDVYFGINIKYLSHYYVLDERAKADPVFAGGKSDKNNMTLDVGILKKIIQRETSALTAGFSIKNLTQPDVGLKSKDPVPMEIRLGAAYGKKIESVVSNLVSALDVSYRNQSWGKQSDKINIHIGQEVSFWNKVLSLRAGGNYNEISCGLGFSTPEKFNINLQLDYAFLFPLQIKESDGSHRLSLTFKFK